MTDRGAQTEAIDTVPATHGTCSAAAFRGRGGFTRTPWQLVFRSAIVVAAVSLGTAHAALGAEDAGKQQEPNAIQKQPDQPVIWSGTVKRVDGENGILTLARGERDEEIRASTPTAAAAVRALTSGRAVIVNVNDRDGRKELHRVGVVVSGVTVFVSLLGATVAWCLFALCIGGRPLKFLVGEDNRYSKSKLQLVLWCGVVLVTYTAALGLRVAFGGLSFAGGINIPQNLLLLSGLSTISFVAAKGITQTKADAAALAGTTPATPAAPRLLSDLVHDDAGRFDLGDFQMLAVTVLAVLAYGLLALDFLSTIWLDAQLTLPDVDSTILAAFGLGQGAYLGKKQVGGLEK